MNFHLFGATTPAGSAFRQLADVSLMSYSRNISGPNDDLYYANLNDYDNFIPAGSMDALSIWISFCPIWLIAPFLEQIATHHSERLQGLRGVIACSSSSAITKCFSSNRFDRDLVARLTFAEDKLIATCHQLSVPCRILRPTLIYGQVGDYGDRNLSRLLAQLRRFPFFPLPAETGLRQPIHAAQLAAVALRFAQQLTCTDSNSPLPERVALGGDTILTYAEMISALQQAQPSGDPARRCRLLLVPNRLFFLLAAPFLLCSPKAFEAVLRMGANLSGFTLAHKLLGSEPQPFPVLPLA